MGILDDWEEEPLDIDYRPRKAKLPRLVCPVCKTRARPSESQPVCNSIDCALRYTSREYARMRKQAVTAVRIEPKETDIVTTAIELED